MTDHADKPQLPSEWTDVLHNLMAEIIVEQNIGDHGEETIASIKRILADTKAPLLDRITRVRRIIGNHEATSPDRFRTNLPGTDMVVLEAYHTDLVRLHCLLCAKSFGEGIIYMNEALVVWRNHIREAAGHGNRH